MSDERRAPSDADEFARQASEDAPGFFREFWTFIRENKMWWIVPIVFVLLLLGVIVWLGGTSAAPFIYTIF